MRALTLSAHGTLDQLVLRDDLPVPPVARPHDVRLRVTAAALNHLDVFVVGGLPGVVITPPWIVGTDATGVVDAVGPAVTTVRPGDTVIVNPGTSCRSCDYCAAGEQPLCVRYRVLGEHLPGTVAEYIVVPETSVRAIPDTVARAEAAAFTLATLTAWRMVVTRARVQAGENVLIRGIGGGVALAALAICKLVGARVWVTSTSRAKLERAAALGADELLDHGDDVARVIRERTGKRGVEVVIDNVGEATWQSSLLALGRGGRAVTCGGTSGPTLQTDVRRMFWNQWTLMGSTMGNDAEMDAITEHFRAGRLRPVVDSVWPMERGREAYGQLAAGRQFGKVVIDVAS